MNCINLSLVLIVWCFCGTSNLAFNSLDDIELLSLYRSCRVITPVVNHVLKPKSLFAGLKCSLPQSPRCLCTSCQITTVFFYKRICLNFLKGAEYKKLFGAKPFVDSFSISNQGKKISLENQNIEVLNWAAQ